MTDTIVEEINELGERVVSYYCSLVMDMNQNVLEDLIVPFYYENIYPCSEDAALGRDYIADALLTRAKAVFLTDASYCTNPQNPWFGKVSSLPEDEIYTPLSCSSEKAIQMNAYNNEMEDLIAMGADPEQQVTECCIVVHGKMTFTKLASITDENIMNQWISDQLNDKNNESWALPYQTQYLGAILDTQPSDAEDNLPPAINVNDGNTSNNNNNNSNFTDLTSSNDKDDNGDDVDNGSGNNGNGNVPPSLPDSSLTDVKPTAATSAPRQQDEGPAGFTWVGVLIVVGLILALCAVGYFVFKRRRHYMKTLDDGNAAALEDSSSEHSSKDRQEKPVVIKNGKTRSGSPGAAEATMSVEEEDYDDDFHVTIVPTHTTNSTQSTGGSIHQRQQQHQDFEDGSGGFVEMLHDDEEYSNTDDAPFQVSVLSDNPNNMRIRSVAVNSFHTANHLEEDDIDADADDNFFVGRRNGRGAASATQTTGSTSSGTYQFDLADANRNAIMGTYIGRGGGGSSSGANSSAAAIASGAPITMTVVPPYPMDETSDSDIDSWAQTEGTVGSLEDRYEETGEI